ncbi:rhodanese [Sporosarcina sp. P18a]|uniref:rhodanese-like domain-containing protein n=1 Tax=unclassified Sporosarcina TaxID=2647733 RepID=UPI000C1665DC|nr:MULTISPECIES: rhodanese-like domain-containing protein [unclassified Sporosarcina]PIC79540.1 rhodanese [Sporosarcina sp. P18a]PID03413.1 rhodanese [Sporosarcina sp. P2]PID26026.1 rhodanese [Sporosarcina sp. P7]
MTLKELTAKEVQEQLESGKELNIIDVREDDEVAEGMIPGAEHIALGNLPVEMHDLNAEIPYILVCRSGGRSGRAQELMADEGFDVTNMVGGMLAWEGQTK